jgi:hypothetical protein
MDLLIGSTPGENIMEYFVIDGLRTATETVVTANVENTTRRIARGMRLRPPPFARHCKLENRRTALVPDGRSDFRKRYDLGQEIWNIGS